MNDRFADASAATFNGTSSRLDLSASALIPASGPQAISMWFKTTHSAGVLFSHQATPITASASGTDFTPALYVGDDGTLPGEFWIGSPVPIKSTQRVDDGLWHHALLASSGVKQTLYLDGQPVGSRNGTVTRMSPSSGNNVYVGAGFLGGPGPTSRTRPHEAPSLTAPSPTSFTTDPT